MVTWTSNKLTHQASADLFFGSWFWLRFDCLFSLQCLLCVTVRLLTVIVLCYSAVDCGLLAASVQVQQLQMCAVDVDVWRRRRLRWQLGRGLSRLQRYDDYKTHFSYVTSFLTLRLWFVTWASRQRGTWTTMYSLTSSEMKKM